MAAIEAKYTAADPSFPEFDGDEPRCVCFNLREGNVEGLEGDQAFRYQGQYAELGDDGLPLIPSWKAKLAEIASTDGAEKVKAYKASKSSEGGRFFYSPAKARRWGQDILGPDRKQALLCENVLVKSSSGAWMHVEVDVTDGTTREFPLPPALCKCITYVSFVLDTKAKAKTQFSVYGKDGSEPAWMDGSTLVRRAREGVTGRKLESLPESFLALRYVPLARREEFLKAVGKAPAFAITGATLPSGSPFASPVSRELAEAVGAEIGSRVDDHRVKIMASASMRGRDGMMSADHDFTLGFSRAKGCRAVHFKGTNLVRLHGWAWTMPHGTSYVVEEEPEDFSNHAKEACLMVSASHAKSVALLAGGGPTVALNLCRMLLTCSAHRTFTITGMHAEGGKSGASGAFDTTAEQQEKAVQALDALAPGGKFEAFKAITADEIKAKLESKPLKLLDRCPEKGSKHTEYIMQPGKPNQEAYPGLKEKEHIGPYAASAANQIASMLRPKRKPTFKKVTSIKPDSKGVNVMVVCVSAPSKVEGKDVFEVVVGDETGIVTLSLSDEQQTSACKVGASLRVQNAHVKMVRGHVRLAVDKWAALKAAEVALEVKANEAKDLSAVEYELVG